MSFSFLDEAMKYGMVDMANYIAQGLIEPKGNGWVLSEKGRNKADKLLDGFFPNDRFLLYMRSSEIFKIITKVVEKLEAGG